LILLDFSVAAASAKRAFQQAGKKEGVWGKEFLPACSESEAPPLCSFRAEASKKVFFSF